MRFPYQRLSYMFDALQSETLPQEELAKRFAVSTRTVRADITALNEILEHYGAHFVHNRGFGYRLMVEDADRFRSLQQQNRKVHLTPRTANERVHYLLIRFLTYCLFIEVRRFSR